MNSTQGLRPFSSSGETLHPSTGRPSQLSSHHLWYLDSIGDTYSTSDLLSGSNRTTCNLHWVQDLIKNMSFRRTLLPRSERRAVIYYHYSQHLYNINKGRLMELHKLLPNNRQVFFIPWVTRLRLITFKCVLRHTAFNLHPLGCK